MTASAVWTQFFPVEKKEEALGLKAFGAPLCEILCGMYEHTIYYILCTMYYILKTIYYSIYTINNTLYTMYYVAIYYVTIYYITTY